MKLTDEEVEEFIRLLEKGFGVTGVFKKLPSIPILTIRERRELARKAAEDGKKKER